MIIRSKRIYADKGVVDGYLIVEKGKITNICDKSANLHADLDVSDKMIIPGIFDTHNHGTMGYGLMNKGEKTKREIKGYLKGLASQGVTNVFPTAISDIFKDIVAVSKEENDGATILGIHSEGPYLNRTGEKSFETGYPDADMEFVKQMVKDGGGMLKLVALAPEIPGIDEAIKYFTDNGIRVSYAHSDCNYGEARNAFKKGLTIATHASNVMSGIHHRNMGGLGACLLDEDIYCEVICDGLHVAPEMLELMFKVKPYDKWMMISDNAPVAGATTGRYGYGWLDAQMEKESFEISQAGRLYNFGWLEVNVDEQGFCLSDSGRLCGSTKPVLYGMSVLHNELKIPMETIVKMASLNPCIVYGFDKEKGSITVGKDADFVVISDDYKALYTYCNGRKVYDYQVDTDTFNPDFFNEAKLN